MNLDEDCGGGGGRFKKHEPFKRKLRIKKSTPEEKTETVELNVQTTITVTDPDDQEVQEKRRESVAQNDIQDTDNAEEQKNEEAINKEEKKEENAAEEEDVQEEQDIEDKPQENNTKDTNGLTAVPDTPAEKLAPTPKRAPKFKQRASKTFKSKPPKKGVIGFGEDIPGMDGLGADITVICPWEAFSHLELHELAQFGII